jgi:formylglycine-generating enzyme required for sulfatase activity
MSRLYLRAFSVLIAGLICSPALAAPADKRVALVVGNARYGSARPLANPENDARLMAQTLRSLGFALVGGDAQLNLDQDKFRHIVKQFGEQMKGADTGFFYYAGHGIEIDNNNYLVPIDADLTQEADVDFMVDVNLVLRQMAGARTRLNVVVLDACRNNPFAAGGRSMAIGRGRDSEDMRMRDISVAKGGLAQMPTLDGTVIAFATQPGQTADDGADANSPFTKALSEVIKTPGLGILDVLSEVGRQVKEATKRNQRPQRPWFSGSSIEGSSNFVPAAGAATTAVAAAGAEAPAVAPAAAPKTDSAGEIARKFEAAAHSAALEPQQQAKAATPAAAPTPVGLLSPERERALRPQERFKECDTCPEMVTVPAGTFQMGSPVSEAGREAGEGPQQQIAFGHAFAVGRSAVTFAEWNACVAESGCNAYRPGDYGWGGGKRPVINVAWNDAQAYVAWLSKKTGAPYRLLSEAEREYVTRGCTAPTCPSTPFWFGAEIAPARANYDWRYSYNGSAKAQPPRRTVATDASEANPFGLLQVHGNVREWVEDCWNETLAGIPRDGAPRTTGDCTTHVVRGGSWADEPKDLRSAKRGWEVADERRAEIGFRIARTLRN